MLNEPTMDKLRALRLDTLAEAWAEQQKDPEITKLAFDERLGPLVDAEHLARENKRLARLLKEAKLRLGQACVEEIDYPARRELDKVVIRQLATCGWVHEHRNVTVTGATGTGKTFVACAVAQQACRKGYSAIYRRASPCSSVSQGHRGRKDGNCVGRAQHQIAVSAWGRCTRGMLTTSRHCPL